MKIIFFIAFFLPVFGIAQSESASKTLKYEWRKISGPSTYKIDSPMSATTAVSNLVEGVYHFELKVTNKLGLSGRDTMMLTVLPGDLRVFVKPSNKFILTAN